MVNMLAFNENIRVEVQFKQEFFSSNMSFENAQYNIHVLQIYQLNKFIPLNYIQHRDTAYYGWELTVEIYNVIIFIFE